MHLCAAKCKPRGECRQKGVGTAPAGACGSGAPLADNRAKSAALSAQTPPQGQCRGMCRAKRPPKAAVRGEWSQRPCPQAAWRKSAAFSTSCSASAENRTQKDKDKARQPLGAMFQRAAVLYRVKINFEFTLKRVKSLPTPILLYGAFCGFYTGSLLQHSVCCPFRKTHERRLQHHAVP